MYRRTATPFRAVYPAKVLLIACIAALVFAMPVCSVYAETDLTTDVLPAPTEQGVAADNTGGSQEPSAEDMPAPAAEEETAPAAEQDEPAEELHVYRAGERLSDEQERIWFYNIGGGTFGSDMILIESNGRFGLIDTGNRYQDTIEGEDGTAYDLPASEELSSQDAGRTGKDGMIYMIETLGVNHLDFIIATHAHSDHIGGIPEIADLLVLDQAGDTHPLIDAATLYLYKQYWHVNSKEDDLADRQADSWHNDAFFYQAQQAMMRSGAVMVDVSCGLTWKEGETVAADYTKALEAILTAGHM